jgi:hypothetical protein
MYKYRSLCFHQKKITTIPGENFSGRKIPNWDILECPSCKICKNGITLKWNVHEQ